MDVNGGVTGHIISTTIGGKNGEPKQVRMWSMWNHESLLLSLAPIDCWIMWVIYFILKIEIVFGFSNNLVQTVSYMAERIVGTGSFGVVFQASEHKIICLTNCCIIYQLLVNWYLSRAGKMPGKWGDSCDKEGFTRS